MEECESITASSRIFFFYVGIWKITVLRRAFVIFGTHEKIKRNTDVWIGQSTEDNLLRRLLITNCKNIKNKIY